MNITSRNTMGGALASALAALALAACGAADSAEQTEVPVVVDELAVIADGRLAPTRFVQLSFSAGGEIEEVLVEEGDAVEAGQVLVRLGNREQLEAARSAARLELISAELALQEIHDAAGVMTAQAQLNVAQAREELRQADYRWSVQQEGQRASQATINAAEAQLILAKDALDRAKAVYDGVSGRAEDDLERALALTQFAAAQRDYDAALRNLRWYTGRPSETQQGLLDADLAMAQARLEQAQRVWEDRKDGPDADDLALAEARLAHAQAQWSAAEAALSDAELKAPMAGTVAHVLSKAGETAVPGQPAVVIADFTRWIVETENLSEIDLPQVLIGQAVTVAFDALPDVKLAGSVTAIRPLFEIKSGDVVYTVTIGLSEVDPRLQWGMTAVVTFEALAEAAAPGG